MSSYDQAVVPYHELMVEMDPHNPEDVVNTVDRIKATLGDRYDRVIMSQALRRYCMSSRCHQYVRSNIPPAVNTCTNDSGCTVWHCSIVLEDEAIANGEFNR